MLPLQAIEIQYGWSGVYNREAGERIMRTNHIGYRLLMVSDGSLTVDFEGQCWSDVRAGSVLFWPAEATSTIYSAQGCRYRILCFRTLLFGNLDVTHRLAPATVWTPPEAVYRILDTLMTTLTHDNRQDLAARQYLETGITCAIFSICWQMLEANVILEASKVVLPEWLARSLQDIRHRPELTVNQLADMAGMSISRYRCLFHHYIGMSPREYLQRNRLNTAEHLLTTTEMPIHQIAAQLGFENHSHFTRFFVRASGTTPIQYRAAATSEHD